LYALNLAPSSTYFAASRRKAATPRRRRKGGVFSRKDSRLNPTSPLPKEVAAIVFLALIVLTFLSFQGLAGPVGTLWYTLLLKLLGKWGIYLFLIVFTLLGLGTLIFRSITYSYRRVVGLVLLFMSSLGYVAIFDNWDGNTLTRVSEFGGYLGFVSSFFLNLLLGGIGTKVVLLAGFLISLILIFEFSLTDILNFFRTGIPTVQINKNQSDLEEKAKSKLKEKIEEIRADFGRQKINGLNKLNINKPSALEAEINQNIARPFKNKEWQYPTLELLEENLSKVEYNDHYLKQKAEKIQSKLEQFHIPVLMKDINIGPSVMQYTLKPDEGVKLSKILALKNDLALELAAKSIRIEAPIPGKSLVGIEVPNEKRIIVHLREILESKEFNELKSNFRIPLGRSVNGTPMIAELEKMPHLLIAGATGSGKSICIHSIILSFLFQNSPEEARLILVDPKHVELSRYNGIPHLLTPVITDPIKALNALKWAISEMNRRYNLLTDKHARDIYEYNSKVDAEEKVPQIIIIIDELADLMMAGAKKDVESSICRIAQKARAIGMHLVIATQRPSVDVITGLIKANFPSRIAFAVTAGVDSRTILDTVGAEDLLGMGDMLYQPKDLGKPVRIQGVFITSKEISRVSNHIIVNSEYEKDFEVEKEITNPEENAAKIYNTLNYPGATDDPASFNAEDGDALLNEAMEVIRRTGKASASLLQRVLKVGYARAARILDIMEEKGYIGPVQGAKPRDVYLDKISDSAVETEKEETGVL